MVFEILQVIENHILADFCIHVIDTLVRWMVEKGSWSDRLCGFIFLVPFRTFAPATEEVSWNTETQAFQLCLDMRIRGAHRLYPVC